MMEMVKTIIRHWVAVFVGWALATLASYGVEFTPEQAGDFEEGMTTFALAVGLAGYAAVEKILKPLFRKLTGETQPGELTPEEETTRRVPRG